MINMNRQRRPELERSPREAAGFYTHTSAGRKNFFVTYQTAEIVGGVTRHVGPDKGIQNPSRSRNPLDQAWGGSSGAEKRGEMVQSRIAGDGKLHDSPTRQAAQSRGQKGASLFPGS